jgi:putative membrane protein
VSIGAWQGLGLHHRRREGSANPLAALAVYNANRDTGVAMAIVLRDQWLAGGEEDEGMKSAGRLIVSWLITAVALVTAAYVVPGIHVTGNDGFIVVLAMAVILGLVNVLVKPFLSFLSCGLIVLSLGLFLVVINALSLWLSSWIAQNVFNVGFVVDGFWPALWGSIIVSIVSFILSSVLLKNVGRRKTV